jgi:hypothetical protein
VGCNSCVSELHTWQRGPKASSLLQIIHREWVVWSLEAEKKMKERERKTYWLKPFVSTCVWVSFAKANSMWAKLMSPEFALGSPTHFTFCPHVCVCVFVKERAR